MTRRLDEEATKRPRASHNITESTATVLHCGDDVLSAEYSLSILKSEDMTAGLRVVFPVKL